MVLSPQQVGIEEVIVDEHDVTITLDRDIVSPQCDDPGKDGIKWETISCWLFSILAGIGEPKNITTIGCRKIHAYIPNAAPEQILRSIKSSRRFKFVGDPSDTFIAS